MHNQYKPLLHMHSGIFGGLRQTMPPTVIQLSKFVIRLVMVA